MRRFIKYWATIVGIVSVLAAVIGAIAGYDIGP